MSTPVEHLHNTGVAVAELIPYLDTNLFRAAIDQRASEPLRVKMDRMLKIGMPTSVFITPPTATRP